MSKIFTAGTFAVLLCGSLAAQAPTQTPPATAQSSAKAETIVVQGCVQPSVVAVSATPDAVGTAGTVSTATAFILASAMKPAGTSGSSASSSSPVASSYQLDVEDSKLIPHVGHQVEISGTVARLDNKASTSTTAAPTIKVQNVKMLAATCTP
jgi:hypothetical protein